MVIDIEQEIDSVEYGLTDIQEYYANTGALKKAAEVSAASINIHTYIGCAFHLPVLTCCAPRPAWLTLWRWDVLAAPLRATKVRREARSRSASSRASRRTPTPRCVPLLFEHDRPRVTHTLADSS